MTEVSLERVRLQIDALDRQIVALIATRQKWVEKAGRLKKDDAAVRAPGRVEQVVAKVCTLAQEVDASPYVVEETYRAMIGAFIDLELSVHQARCTTEFPSEKLTDTRSRGNSSTGPGAA
ncbi:isochorismate pyruvate lyase [Microbacterium sp. SORGH_AS 1204]|uniref:chorismate mutase n=1 Tax=Microbacterium sp. SORGH_AS_1204 TaxID=3041785 RepID=UPI0027911A84|nr:chorismate mutase [Microbacterium sp. SORGH_AS_1204]MDQ1135729.1 isochorismate pyruvate lyase [Microbacterium sp. SORGH_AS_1204]